MEVVAVKHYAFIPGFKKIDLPARNRHARLKRGSGPSSAVFPRGTQFPYRPLDLDLHTRDLGWSTRHLLSPHCIPGRQSVTALGCAGWGCAGQRTIGAVDQIVGNEHELFFEEKQKVLLQIKADAIAKDLGRTSIFLVGMMGSGKSTVGKYIAEALGYSFFDSDKLVEDAAGTTVSQMFRDGREEEFRNAETEVLMQLSSMGNVVVATGGGAVVRPQNWGYMRHGITVWLDVPLDALARRVVAVGCESRPLLGQVSQDSAHHQALKCLTHLFEQREECYSNADAAVSVAALAGNMGLDDVGGVTPPMLAVQVLEEVADLIQETKVRKGGLWSDGL